MVWIFGAGDTLQETGDIFERIQHNFLNIRSLIVLAICLSLAFVIGRIVAILLRRVVTRLGRSIDKIENLHTVNRLRRYETIIVLSIAVIRSALVMFALYFWWLYVHPNGQPAALIGASAFVIVILSGALSPALRDIAAGTLMMGEQWYGVGDHVRVEPFVDMQGVVERVTLRSTRIRGLNGEVLWVNNQHIQAIRVAPKGLRTIGLEMFVTNIAAGEKLIAMTNKRLPIGPLLVVSPLEIISVAGVGENLWHITAVGEAAPGREWLIENSAVDLIKWLDARNKTPVLAHGPLARYADSEAERKFNRTIRNARKKPAPTRRAVAAKKSAKKAK